MLHCPLISSGSSLFAKVLISGFLKYKGFIGIMIVFPEVTLDKSEFVCVDALRSSQQFFSHVGMFSCLPGLTSIKQRIKCLAEGHNTVPLVSLELATLGSKVLHSTTEPLHSSIWNDNFDKFSKYILTGRLSLFS